MAMDDSSVRCPLCRARFDSSVALVFHGRREHSGATSAVDLAARDLPHESAGNGRQRARNGIERRWRISAARITRVNHATPDSRLPRRRRPSR